MCSGRLTGHSSHCDTSKAFICFRVEEYVPLKKRRQMEEERRLLLRDRLQVRTLGRFPLACHILGRTRFAIRSSPTSGSDRLGHARRQPLSSLYQMTPSQHMLTLLWMERQLLLPAAPRSSQSKVCWPLLQKPAKRSQQRRSRRSSCVRSSRSWRTCRGSRLCARPWRMRR